MTTLLRPIFRPAFLCVIAVIRYLSMLLYIKFRKAEPKWIRKVCVGLIAACIIYFIFYVTSILQSNNVSSISEFIVVFIKAFFSK